jgi:hypothetical protein
MRRARARRRRCGGVGVLSLFWLLGAMLLGAALAVRRFDVE